ncbi:MAG: hypothetical protein LAT65_05410 [Saccharospirillum sp.]|nr:hypothetical protein [Saccharospirillum sp.]
MRIIQIAAAVLIVASLLALTYGGFTYTKETFELTPGLLMLTFEGEHQVHIPAWASAGGIFIGGLLLFVSRSTLKRPGSTTQFLTHKES